jgi:hypothetical protein
MKCKLCDKGTATQKYGVSALHWSLCQKCIDANYAGIWQCENCTKYFDSSHRRYFGTSCKNCIPKEMNCENCCKPIKNPTRRNWNNAYPYCDKCLIDNDDAVAFGDRQSSVKYAKIGSRRSFGVELETCYSPNLTKIIKETEWGFYQDGSIEGMEFTSPPMSGNAGYNSIRKFCRLARSMGYQVDRECGFHLHINVTDFNETQIKNLCLAYHLTYPTWKSLVAQSRHHSGFCIYDKRNLNIETLDLRHYINKFNWTSLSNLWHYGTVEVRLHQGTLCFQKIINWVRAHIKFVDWTKRHTTKEISDMFVADWLVDDSDQIYRKLRRIWKNKLIKEYMGRRRRFLCRT